MYTQQQVSIAPSTTTKVLSLLDRAMGCGTFGHLMRSYFTPEVMAVDFCWSTDERALVPRLINRLLTPQVIRAHNLDILRFRQQLGHAYLVRDLIRRKLNGHQILHFHTDRLAFACLDLLQRMPTVVSLDMTEAQAADEACTHRWTFAPNVWLEKQVFESATQIVAWSEYGRQSVINDYGITPQKVSVIAPGVNTQTIYPTTVTKTGAGLPKLLFVGGDFQRKGGEDVLAVFLANFGEQAELHLVTTAAISCEHPHVHIHRNITAYSVEWLELYQMADLFVLPTYFDAFGMVFLEAMAAGLPIVATRINAVPELVQEGKNGFLVAPGDRQDLAQKISWLLGNAQLRQAMGRQARLLAETRFDFRYNFAQWQDLFTQIAQEPVCV